MQVRGLIDTDYSEFLSEQLKDPELAAEYLSAASEGSTDEFVLALRTVAEAYGGVDLQECFSYRLVCD